MAESKLIGDIFKTWELPVLPSRIEPDHAQTRIDDALLRIQTVLKEDISDKAKKDVILSISQDLGLVLILIAAQNQNT